MAIAAMAQGYEISPGTGFLKVPPRQWVPKTGSLQDAEPLRRGGVLVSPRES